jgi:1-deoxy-D-xylulose 5-phosphate reductoisomerase
VAAFLDSRLAFTAIPEVIASAMDRYDAERPGTVRGLDDVRAVDRWARAIAAESTGKVQSKS